MLLVQLDIWCPHTSYSILVSDPMEGRVTPPRSGARWLRIVGHPPTANRASKRPEFGCPSDSSAIPSHEVGAFHRNRLDSSNAIWMKWALQCLLQNSSELPFSTAGNRKHNSKAASHRNKLTHYSRFSANREKQSGVNMSTLSQCLAV